MLAYCFYCCLQVSLPVVSRCFWEWSLAIAGNISPLNWGLLVPTFTWSLRSVTCCPSWVSLTQQSNDQMMYINQEWIKVRNQMLSDICYSKTFSSHLIIISSYLIVSFFIRSGTRGELNIWLSILRGARLKRFPPPETEWSVWEMMKGCVWAIHLGPFWGLSATYLRKNI